MKMMACNEYIFDFEYKLVGEENLNVQIIEEDSILPTLFEETYDEIIED